jgi:uncharacterized protein DUF6152
MTTTRVCAIVALLFALVTPLGGHHAFAAYYLEDQSVSIDGTLVELDYTNPHAWIHVAAADKSGQLRKVSAEWSNPGRLRQQGIEKETLRPGDRLILTGSPSRNQSELKLHLKRLERPVDGWSWVGRGQQRF